MSGFSVQNLKSIRYWYKFYNSNENGLQPVSQMELIVRLHCYVVVELKTEKFKPEF